MPRELRSCHTTRIGGYVVVGHVPADAIQRLLREKPANIVGIAVPGMPLGSPGMEMPGGHVEPYDVMAWDREGRITIFERR